MHLFNMYIPTIYYNEQDMIDFLRQFEDRLDWHWIRYHVKFTYRIIHEFEDKLSDFE